MSARADKDPLHRIALLALALLALTSTMCVPAPTEQERVSEVKQTVISPPAEQATSPHGTIEGTAAVTQGAFTYRIPLVVPDGVAGVQPQLALSYSSMGGNGLLGVGWTLEGGSVITRCPRTVATDGVATDIDFEAPSSTELYPYCIDGKRLFPVGPRANNQVSYYTVPDQFSKITGIFSGTEAHPSTFRVDTRDGRTFVYGGTANNNARVRPNRRTTDGSGADYALASMKWEDTWTNTYAWYLSSIYAAGDATNLVQFTYENEDHTNSYPIIGPGEQSMRLLSRITYGGTTLWGWPREVQFVYEARPANDPLVSAVSGYTSVSHKRLKRVETRGPKLSATNSYLESELLGSYNLEYAHSRFTQRSLLRSVQRCDGTSTGCLPATKFEWSDAAAMALGITSIGGDYGDITLAPFYASGDPQLTTNEHTRFWLADFSGDGRDDLVYSVGPAFGSSGYNMRIRLGGPNGLGLPQVITGGKASLRADPHGSRPADLNSDGIPELVLVERDTSRAYRFTGGTEVFTEISQMAWFATALATPPLDVTPWPIGVGAPTGLSFARGRLALADFNGDGVLDVLAHEKYDPGTSAFLGQAQYFRMGARTFAPFATLNLTTMPTSGSGQFYGYKVARLASSGLPATYRGGGNVLDQTGQFGIRLIRHTGVGIQPRTLDRGVTLSDVNGDGLDDFIYFGGSLRPQKIWLNTGRGALAEIALPYETPGVTSLKGDNNVISADFNNDGRQDLLLLGAYTSGGVSGHGVEPMQLLYSTGTGYTPVALPLGNRRVLHALPVPELPTDPQGTGFSTTAVGDVDGDGYIDIVQLVRPTSDPADYQLEVRRVSPKVGHLAQRNDVIIGVTNGLQSNSSEGQLWGERVTYSDLPALTDAGRYMAGVASECAASTVRCLRRGPLVVATHSSGLRQEQSTVSFAQRYSYISLLSDNLGRGSLGFTWTEVADPLLRTYVQEYHSPLGGNFGGYAFKVDTSTDPAWLGAFRTGNYGAQTPDRQTVYLRGVSGSTNAPSTTGFTYKWEGVDSPNAPSTGPTRVTVSEYSNQIHWTRYNTNFTQALSFSIRPWWRGTGEEYSAQAVTNTTPLVAAARSSATADRYTSINFLSYDDYDNPLKVTEATTGGTSRTVETDYYTNNTGTSYALGLPHRVTETRTKTGSSTAKRVTEYAWSGSRLQSVTRMPSTATSPVYDSSEAATVDDLFQKVEFSYGVKGHLIGITERAFDKSESTELGIAPQWISRTTTLEYNNPVSGDPDLAYPSAVITPSGTTTLVVNPVHGQPVELGEGGVTTYRGYDGLGRLMGEWRQGDSSTTWALAAADATSPGAFKVTQTSSAGAKSEDTYDYLGRGTRLSTLAFDGTWLDTIIAYDVERRPRTRSMPWVRGQSGGVSVQYGYDSLHRLQQLTNPDSTTRTLSYPDLFTIEKRDEGAALVVERRDRDGLLSSTEDQLKSAITTADRTVTTRFTYDSFGNPLTSSVNNTAATNWTYDDIGRPTTIATPSTRTYLRYNGFDETRWSQRNLDPARRTLHDKAGRITLQKTDSTHSDGYVYDGELLVAAFAVDGDSDNAIVENFYYDSYNRLILRRLNVDGNDLVMSLSYDTEGRLYDLTYPGMGVDNLHPPSVRHTYTNGHLSKLQWKASSATTWSELWRMTKLSPTRVEEVSGDNTLDALDRNARGQVTGWSSGTSDSFAYLYHPNGDLKKRTAGTGATDEMLYDTLGRLERWTRTGGNAFRREYSYDDLGSMTATKTFNAATGGTVVEQQNFVVGAPNVGYQANPFAVASENGSFTRSFTYDSNGRRRTITEASGTTTFAYNHWDLPTSLTGAVSKNFRYTAFGSRAAASNSTDAIYYFDNLSEDRVKFATAQHEQVSHVYANGRVVAHIKSAFTAGQTTAPTQTVSYPHADPLGSVTTLSNEGALKRFYYEPFGQRVTADGKTPASAPTTVERNGFAGHEHDSVGALDLINMEGRLYDPKLRRFISADPLAARPSRSQSWNSYAYAWNNPLRFIDPTGWAPGDYDDPIGLPEIVIYGSARCGAVACNYEVPGWDGDGGGSLPSGSSDASGYSSVEGYRQPSFATQGPSDAPNRAELCAGQTGWPCQGGGGTSSIMGQKEFAGEEGAAEFWQTAMDVVMLLSPESGAVIGSKVAGLARWGLRGGGLAGRKAGSLAARTASPAALVITGMCFAEGTLVHTEDGLKPIERVAVGDRVWALDEVTGDLTLRAVAQLFETPNQPIVEVTIEHGDGAEETIRTTTEHPFWVGEGWVPASELAPDDRIRLLSGASARVSRLTQASEKETVYNFEVDTLHTYFVGERGALVHNNSTIGRSLGARGLSMLSRAATFGIRPYKGMTQALKGTGLQAHHLIEKRFAALLGQNARHMLSIAVTPLEHQVFTNAWRTAIPLGQGTANATRQQVMDAARQIYAHYPDVLLALGL